MSVRNSKAILLRPYLYENEYNIAGENVINSILNSIFAPSFETKDEICIVYRIFNRTLVNNHLLRLKFSDVKTFDLNDLDCGDTQFLIISTKQYSACILFDFSLSEKEDTAVFCTYFNSKKISEILKILLPDTKFSQERRENTELNIAILNLIKFSENSLAELNINEIEKNNLESINQNLKRDEFLAKKSRYISHEIKNHLSIIDIYAKIIEKTDKNPSIQNATELIFKSIYNITKQLKELKNFSEAELNVYGLNEIINETVNSTIEFANAHNVKIETVLSENCNVLIDKDKFQNTLLNLIKNGVEAFKECDKENKFIRIVTEKQKENDTQKISLKIANNGEKIDKANQTKIFEEGFTTKDTGTGLGLYICKQNLNEQFCELSLLKSTNNITVFEILMNEI